MHHAYVGRCRECGCAISIHLDIPGHERATAEWVATMIRQGLVVNHEAPPAEGFRLGTPCTHREQA